MYISEKKKLPKSVEVFIKYYHALHLTCVNPLVRLLSLGGSMVTTHSDMRKAA